MKKLMFSLSVLLIAGAAVTFTSCKKKVNPGFTANPTAGIVGQPVSFIDSETAERKNATVSWDFGDGEKSYDRNPSHIYWIPGTYHVYQTVTINSNAEKGKGVSETATLDVVVTGGPSSAFTASTLSAAIGQTVNFTNTSTGGNMYTWTIISDNGTAPVVFGPTAVKDFSTVFSTSGNYTVTLTCDLTIDFTGMASSSSSQTVAVSGTSATANAAAKVKLYGKWTSFTDNGVLSGNGSATPFTCTAWGIADGPYVCSPLHTSLQFDENGDCWLIDAHNSNQTTGTMGTWSMSADGNWLTFAGPMLTQLNSDNPGFAIGSTFKINTATFTATSLTLTISDNCGPTSGAPAVRVRTLVLTR